MEAGATQQGEVVMSIARQGEAKKRRNTYQGV